MDSHSHDCTKSKLESGRATNRYIKIKKMKANFKWFSASLIILVAVYLVDLNLMWLQHPANTIPVLKYSIIGLSVILFLMTILITYRKQK